MKKQTLDTLKKVLGVIAIVATILFLIIPFLTGGY